MADAALAAILKRDHRVVGSALALVALSAWVYVVWLSRSMPSADSGMAGMDMGAIMAPGFSSWTPAHGFFLFVMWAVMMTGMMTPSATPMVLLYTQVARQARTLGRVFAPAAWFAGGYLLAWTAFAALAASGQYWLERVALLSPMMAATSRHFGGAVLVAAGLYQFTPTKHGCLSRCRAPLRFVQEHGGFRPDAWGSLRLGVLHGLFCVGCCWALMALLFVGGVMNLLWIAAIAAFVLGEKVLPGGVLLARVAGASALAAGVWMLFE
jgi:predicted metal-binding membrane protein